MASRRAPRSNKKRRKRGATRKQMRRKRTTTKRRSPGSIISTAKQIKRVKRTGTPTGTFAQHHAIRQKPFSNATTQPKIPDGLLTSSLARRLANVKSIRNGTNGDICHVVLCPGLGVPVLVTNTTEGASLRPGQNLECSFIGYPGQTVGWQNTIEATSAPTWPHDGSLQELVNLGGFHKWRTVSQGLRIDLTNSDEENDGWFEVVRFNWRGNAQDLCLTPLDGGTTNPQVGVAPNPEWVTQVGEPMSMVEQPGYMTGKLKDLHKYEFMNHPGSPHHPARELGPFRYQNSMEMNGQVLQPSDKHQASQLVDRMQDGNYDWIYIRLHCRPNNGTTVLGSSFIFNVITNVEVAFNPTSDFAAFQTINKLDKNHEKVADAINNDRDGAHRRRK